MVFYFLARKEAERSERRALGVVLAGKAGGRRKVAVVEGTVDSLMRRPAMPIREVRLEGNARSIIADLFSNEVRRRMEKTETLRQTLKRIKAIRVRREAKAAVSGSPKARNSKEKRTNIHPEPTVVKGDKGTAVASNGMCRADGGDTYDPTEESLHSLMDLSSASWDRDENDLVDLKPQACASVADNEANRDCPVGDGKEDHFSIGDVPEIEASSPLSGDANQRFPDELTQIRSESRDAQSSLSIPGSDRPRSSKAVTFTTIEVRRYRQCLGDNPACSDGPPISLSWIHSPLHRRYPVDDYEAARRGVRRNVAELRMSELQRVELLVDAGYTFQELLEADVRKTKDQLLRERTLGNLRYTCVEEIFESVRFKYLLRTMNQAHRTNRESNVGSCLSCPLLTHM
uniref:Uncharacterized protein n=1 Tax=Odontella aurita TaxID=265563 RepID=A0A7S4K302_9STRA|mmetsp:Transcript_6029/g.17617  ORF Transcript_6029/g.17617 Transcript_6029/m.17617 type:complete len:402 (+) Transcript_6029:170-1375(+)